MASDNQNRPKGQNQGKEQGHQNGGTFQNVREQVQDAGQRLQEQAGHVGDRLHEHADRAREGAAHHYRRAEGMMARNPTQTVLLGFGIGFGIGLALTALLAEPEETWADRHLPGPVRDRLPRSWDDLADSGRDMAGRLADSGRDMADRLVGHLPRRFRG